MKYAMHVNNHEQAFQVILLAS